MVYPAPTVLNPVYPVIVCGSGLVTIVLVASKRDLEVEIPVAVYVIR